MDRRRILSGVGANFLLLSSGCLIPSTESEPVNEESEGDADEMADKFTFNVSVSGTTDHLEITGEPANPPLEESRGQMELLVTNLSSTELVPASESAFFPSSIVLTPSNSIEELQFTRDEQSDDPQSLSAGETQSQMYTAEFSLFLLDRTFETSYTIQYQYDEKKITTEVSLEIVTEILEMDSN